MESRNDQENVDLLVLLNEFGLKPDIKKNIIEIMTDQIGMKQDEKFGTIAFSGKLELLNNITDEMRQMINSYQLKGRLYPVLKCDLADEEFRQSLLRFPIFQPSGGNWKVDVERTAILTYDINYKSGRRTRRYYTLKKVGAMKIFPSCYWIPENRMGIIANKFRQMVRESEEDPNYDKNGTPIKYHYRIFRCYPIGSTEGLARWREMQLRLFLDVISSLYARTLSRFNFFVYTKLKYHSMNNEERNKAMRKVKKMRYWKKKAISELRPYMGVHIERMESMGIAHDIIKITQKIDVYDDDGTKDTQEIEIATNIEQSLHQLTDTLNELKDGVYEFIRQIREEKRQKREQEKQSEEDSDIPRQLSSDQL